MNTEPAFEAGARAFKLRQPCRAPARLFGEELEFWENGWWAAADEERGPEIEPWFDPRQIPLPFIEARP